MSRIGKRPLMLEKGIELTIQDQKVTCKGPKGQLSFNLPESYVLEKTGDLEFSLKPKNEKDALWGTLRSCLQNMITGVKEGFRKDLEFNGVGYKASVVGQKLTLNLGYSHPIDYVLPQGIECKVNKNVIELFGFDKVLLGKVAADIRSFRKPEPYKGKGIKYIDEVIIRKAGKTGAKK